MEDALIQVVELGEQSGTDDDAAIGATAGRGWDKAGASSQSTCRCAALHTCLGSMDV